MESKRFPHERDIDLAMKSSGSEDLSLHRIENMLPVALLVQI